MYMCMCVYIYIYTHISCPTTSCPWEGERLAEYDWKPHRVCWLNKAYHRPPRIGIHVNIRGVRFHRIRDLKQYCHYYYYYYYHHHLNSSPPTCQRAPQRTRVLLRAVRERALTTAYTKPYVYAIINHTDSTNSYYSKEHLIVYSFARSAGAGVDYQLKGGTAFSSTT